MILLPLLDLKQPGLLSVLGLAVVAGGEILRKMAMWQAGTNFNHYVRHVKEDGHILITSGVYGLFRHPSYVGWFYWSIATQVLEVVGVVFTRTKILT